MLKKVGIFLMFLALVLFGFYLFFKHFKKNNPESISDLSGRESTGAFVEGGPFSKLLSQENDLDKYNHIGGPRYPGFGDIFITTLEGYILIKEKDDSTETYFWDIKSNENLYPQHTYEVENLPVTKYLNYSVGFFSGWEQIEGSSDKYILVYYKYPDEIHKFRVISTDSAFYDYEVTGFYLSKIEDDVKPAKSPLNNLDPIVAGYRELTVVEAIDMLVQGDPVVMYPMFDLPDFSRRDNLGNYIASFLVIRK